MFLAGMSLWILFLIFAVSVLGGLILARKIGKAEFGKAVKLGMFLVVFDFIFENIGAAVGLWHTAGSSLQLLAVPVEVVGIAFCSGFVYSLLFSKMKRAELIFICSIIAVAGTVLEAALIKDGMLFYTGWWNSYLAYVSYLIAFFMLGEANRRL